MDDDEVAAGSALTGVLNKGFERFYCLDAGGTQRADICVRRHPNGLLVLSLAPSHYLLAPGSAAVREVKYRSAMSENEAFGKRAKGGANVGPKTVLADVRLEDGSEKTILATLEARLVELNDLLPEDPSLLCQYPDDSGFIAILQPRRPQDAARVIADLLCPEGFVKARPEQAMAAKNSVTGLLPGPVWAASACVSE
mmetsp:Transcript_5526/g.9865  ORF Transcript_5526/g.9865 Transcript_5526/m.9865 type:complete len:197 (-) Transcript_5526:21-611(-)